MPDIFFIVKKKMTILEGKNLFSEFPWRFFAENFGWLSAFFTVFVSKWVNIKRTGLNVVILK